MRGIDQGDLGFTPMVWQTVAAAGIMKAPHMSKDPELTCRS